MFETRITVLGNKGKNRMAGDISKTRIKPITEYLVRGIKQGHIYLNELAELLPVEYIDDYYIEELFEVLNDYKIAIYHGDIRWTPKPEQPHC